MAWLPFVPSFRGHLKGFKRRNNKRGLIKKKGNYKKHKYNRYGVRSKLYFPSFGSFRRFKDKDPVYSDSSIVDKKGNVTRIPWWSDDRE